MFIKLIPWAKEFFYFLNSNFPRPKELVMFILKYSNFPTTNKPSSNDFYPNKWGVIIFLIWSLLLVSIYYYFFYLLFWILGFILIGLASEHNTNDGSQVFSRFWDCSNIFLGDIGLFKKMGIDSCINRGGGFDGYNNHMKAALALSLLASLHG